MSASQPVGSKDQTMHNVFQFWVLCSPNWCSVQFVKEKKLIYTLPIPVSKIQKVSPSRVRPVSPMSLGLGTSCNLQPFEDKQLPPYGTDMGWMDGGVSNEGKNNDLLWLGIEIGCHAQNDWNSHLFSVWTFWYGFSHALSLKMSAKERSLMDVRREWVDGIA